MDGCREVKGIVRDTYWIYVFVSLACDLPIYLVFKPVSRDYAVSYVVLITSEKRVQNRVWEMQRPELWASLPVFACGSSMQITN